MDFIDTDDEIIYTEEDIRILCQKPEDLLDINTILNRREKKERREIYEKENLTDLIKDIEIGKELTEKYNLAVETNTPYYLVYKEKNKYFSIRDILTNNDNILDALKELKNNYNISLNDFIFAYYFSNISKESDFIINKLNKLTKISNIEFKEDEWSEKIRSFDIKFSNRMETTKKNFKKIKDFYKEINDLEFSNSPEKINKSLVLEKTKVEVDFKVNNIKVDIDNGIILFNSIRLDKNFIYMQYNSFEKNFYKIYDKESSLKNIINIKEELFNILDEEEKENNLYLIYKIQLHNKPYYILIILDLLTSKIYYEYPSNITFKLTEDIKNLINNLTLKKEKIISVKGSFELTIKNFEDLNLYYLTLNDKKVSNFIYVNENLRPRSLMKNVKYYYKNYEEIFLEKDYTITFIFEKLHTNNYSVIFRSKLLKEENDINEFALILSKLITYYQQYDFDTTDIPLILNPYTGKDGDGLGGNLGNIKILKSKFNIGSKLSNLKKTAPEIFLTDIGYSRKCPCQRQPIIIDEEDEKDWNKEKGSLSLSIFPPLNSVDKNKKKYTFVCPTEENIMNYILNPDLEAPFPILPCCTKNKRNNYYDNYNEIKKNPSKYLSNKLDQTIDIKNIKKTIAPLSLGQIGYLTKDLDNFLSNIYEGSEFSRIGISKNSKSSFFHCILYASDHLKYIQPKIKNKRYINNTKIIIKFREKYLNQDVINREIYVNKLKELINDNKTIKINKEILSQELYNYDNDYINYILDHDNFDSKLFYRLLEYLFFVNIFVFSYKNEHVVLEKPRHQHYHNREIREKLPAILIFKHENTNPVNYEIIKVDEQIILDNKISIYMKKYIENNGYYISEFINEEYVTYKNFYNNINWNLILKNYEIIGQFINDSGRAYAINFKYGEEKKATIFIKSSFPLDVPRTNIVYKIDENVACKLFGKKYMVGSEGFWYQINKEYKIFLPIIDIKEKKKNICYEYILNKKKNIDNFKNQNLNIIKKNATIVSQIILWIWNISPQKNLDEWFEIYISDGNKQKINSINNNNLQIEYFFPTDIKTTEEAIEYYSEYIPYIFGNNQIFLYKELKKSIYLFIKNYIKKTEGYGKLSNNSIVGIFNNENNFDKKLNNKIIIGEKKYDDWVNLIKNDEKEIINYNYIDQKREFLIKINNNISIFQNNINSSLKNTLLTCKIWDELKVNMGYYFTTVSVWKILKNYNNLMKILNLDEEKIINIANEYNNYFEITTYDEAITYLVKEKIEYELKDDLDYITINYENYINKDNSISENSYTLFSYGNETYASIFTL